MANATFPPGSEINGYVIELFLSRRNNVTNYLAVDGENNKFMLAVYDYPGGIALEEDIRRWADCRQENISSEIFFYSYPCTMAVMPCVCGLTLEEFFMAGRTLNEDETLDLLRQAAGALDGLKKSGITNWHLRAENFFIMPDQSFLIQRDCSADSLRESPGNTFRKLAVDVLGKVPELSAHGKAVCGRLRKLPVGAELDDISAILRTERPKSSPFSGFKIACGVLVPVLIAAAGIKMYQIKNRNEKPEPQVTTQTLTVSHRSQGPVIHASLAETADKEKTVVKPLPKPLETVEEKAVREEKKPETVERPAPRKVRPRRVPVRKKVSPDISVQTAKNTQPLVADAARRGNLRDLRGLIASGYNIHLRDRNGKTAMQYAAAANWTTMIDLLFQSGAKITPEVLNSAGNAKTRRYLENLLNPPPPRVRPAVSKAVTPVKRIVVPNIKGWKKPDRKSWHITLESALLEARPQKKKIFVLFTGADWCGPCKALASQVLSSADFRRLAKKMELVYINFPQREKQPPAQKAYNEKVRRELQGGGGVPNVLILDHTGKTIGRIGGYRPKDTYLKELKRLIR